MHGWVLDVEQILDGSWAKPGEGVCNATVGCRLDARLQQMTGHLADGTLSDLEQKCLTSFLQVLSNLRPHLVQCYDREDFPASPIMTWNAAFVDSRPNTVVSVGVRTGTVTSYAMDVTLPMPSDWEQDADHQQQLVLHATQLNPASWREQRRQCLTAQSERLMRFRFRNIRHAYLKSLEERWAAAASTSLLP